MTGLTLAPCADCGAPAGTPCHDSCPSLAAAEALQIEIDLDNPAGRCCTYPLCICHQENP